MMRIALKSWMLPLATMVVIVISFAASSLRAETPAERQSAWDQKITPFLKTYCHSCHGGEKAKGELFLDRTKDAAALASTQRKMWMKARDMLRVEEMPPEDSKTKPTAAERASMVAWLDAAVNAIDCSPGAIDPGRVTIRRLNRFEYRNTIRDLVGVDFQPAENFPADDVGYGFDNIGDVLTLPPVLLEKYLAAAQEISAKAIVTEGLAQPVSKDFNGFDLESSTKDTSRVGLFSRSLNSEGTATAKVDFPNDGEYTLSAAVHGDQAGLDSVRIAFVIDGKPGKEIEVKSTANKPETVELKTRIAKGSHRIGISFLNDHYDPQNPDPKQRDRNAVIHMLRIRGPHDFRDPNLPASHRKIIFVEPTAEKSRRDVTRDIGRRLATRAFRRPATDSEVDRLGRLARSASDRGESFEQSVQLMLQAVLCSPHFLFRVELDSEDPNRQPIRDLNDFELATRLSYFLWSSAPDDELFALAEKGELRKGDNLAQQTRRMLKDPKSRSIVDNFAGQWLELRRLADAMPDKSKFPTFDNKLRAAMRRETELFFESVMREDRSLITFLDADYSYLNEPLARHYGIEGVSGDEFREVSLAGTQRGGLITQASILTVTSNPTRTSPVKRGKWVLENLLADPPPPPPPNVPELDKGELKGTLRQQMEQHRVNAACATCHQRLDPLGFALENFDAVGAWRDRDGTAPVDASGELPGGEKFNGAAALRALLVKTKKEAFLRCMAEKMLTYALGRGLEYYDKCSLDRIVIGLSQNENRMSVLVTEIVNSEPFTRRRTK